MAFPIVAVLGALAGIVEKIIPDPQAAAEAKLRLFEMTQKGELAFLESETRLAAGQLEINKAEASSGPFRGGWRPFIGWTCGVAFAFNFVGVPLLGWVSGIYGFPVPPALDLTEMTPVLLGMLGLGGLRSWERINNKA
jgi:hypothetical protein